MQHLSYEEDQRNVGAVKDGMPGYRVACGAEQQVLELEEGITPIWENPFFHYFLIFPYLYK